MSQQEADTRQLELPLSGDKKLQIAALLKIRAPPVISKTRQRGVAEFIEQIARNADSDGFCRLSQEVMASKQGIDVRTYRRRRQDVKDLKLLKTQGRDSFGSTMADAVDWQAASSLARNIETTVSGSVQEAPIAHDSAAIPDKCPVYADIFPLPKPEFSYENTNRTITKTINGQPTLVAQGSDKCPVRAGKIFVLSLDDLGNPDRVDEWFQWAVGVGRALVCDKPRIFAAAHSVLRRHREACQEGRSREAPEVPAFVSNVRHRRWYANGIDDEWAHRALLYLDRQESELC